MLQTVQNQIEESLKEVKAPRLLLACSGGVDSMVLLHLLQQLDYPMGVAHVNFLLRDEEANADEAFVKIYCTSRRLPVHTQQYQTEAYAKEQGISIQMAARALRYEWFETLQSTHHYTHVLTAHHLDDQLETLLINLGRGTGLRGLQGISSSVYLRPLLSFSKLEILKYAQDHKLNWREDASNAKTDYLRNHLRHAVITPWKEAHPSLLDNVKKSLDYLSLAQQALSVQIEKFKEKHFIEDEGSISVSLKALNTLKPLDYYLHTLFSAYGFLHLADLKAMLVAQSGKYLVSDTHRLWKNREELILSEIGQEEETYYEWTPTENLASPISLRLSSTEEKTPSTAVLAKEKLKYPLILRKYRKGDYFYPAGMKGKKKLSKFFKDLKYSPLEKKQQWLLCSEDQIIWVIGQRVDERFAAKEDTHNPLKISCS